MFPVVASLPPKNKFFKCGTIRNSFWLRARGNLWYQQRIIWLALDSFAQYVLLLTSIQVQQNSDQFTLAVIKLNIDHKLVSELLNYQLTLKLSVQMEINCNRDYENANTLKSTAILSCEVISSCSSDLKGESGKRIKIAFLNRSVPLLWANLFFAIVLLSAEVGNRVVLPLWVDSANGTVTGATMNPYFALSFSSIVFFIIFGLGTMFIRVFSPKDIGDTEERFPHLLLFLVGFCDALNGVLILFACKGSRTPPYLQAILGNFLIPLTVLFRWVRFMYIKKLGFKKHMPRSQAS